MTMARSRLVDLDVTRYYHSISRCVRGAFLGGEGYEHRKQWIEDRLELLASNFAISVCGFSVMDDHLHVLVRLDPDVAKKWSNEEVVRRWNAVYPPRTLNVDDPKAMRTWIDQELADASKVTNYRQRLTDLGWLMKAIREPLARLANKEDDCKGTFWESRYKSIAVLDEEALLATCAYIDLNPVVAGMAATPETSRHTSVRQRVRHVKAKGKLKQLKAGSRAAGRIEQDHWLCPLEDRRGRARQGMLEGLSLGNYLSLVDYTSRLYRNDKARLSREVAGIFERLGASPEFWGQWMKALFSESRLLGSYFTTDRNRLRELAARRGVHHLDNVITVSDG